MKKNPYKILVGKSNRKKPPGRARHEWDNDLKTGLKENGY
jgi:hypothetical protein